MTRRKARAARLAEQKNEGEAAITNGQPTDTTMDTTMDATIPGTIPSHPAPTEQQQQSPPGGQAQGRKNDEMKKRKEDAKKTPVLETTEVDGITYQVQPEGLAKILLPADAKKHAVFYNPIQQFNRDLTMAVTRGYCEILEAERKTAKRKHRGGFKHNKRRRSDEKGNAVVALENAENEAIDEDTNEDGIRFHIDGAGDVGMADASPTNESDDSTKPKPRFAVLDALSATGLRALRYAKEIPFVTSVTANDMSESAAESITRNIEFNQVPHIIKASLDNAIGHMYRTAYPPYISDPKPDKPLHKRPAAIEKYHVIDLDPYGTASPFIDSALQALEDGGLLSVTCTDAAIFASTSYPEKTFATYGGLPAKGDFSHEAGLRMVLMNIATTAGKYGLYIEPLLSLSIDYYCRVFVRVRKSPENVKKLASKSMIVVSCDSGCGAWKVQEMGTMRERVAKAGKPDGDKENKKTETSASYKYGVAQAVDSGSCEHCGFKMHITGPMWSDPIHSAGFINHLLSNVLGNEVVRQYGTLARITGMVKLALGELLPPATPAPIAPSTPDEEEQPASDTATAPGQPTTKPPTLKRKFIQRNKAAAKGQPESDSTNNAPSVPTHKQRNPTSDPLSFFIMPTQLSRVLHCEAPSVPAFRGALLHLGYHVTKSHCRPGSIKTNAPWSTLWRIMRAWVQGHPIKEGSLTENMAGYTVMYGGGDRDEDYGDVVFDEGLGKEKQKEKGVVNYQVNPNAYWGPMAKASKKGLTAEEASRIGNAEKDKRMKEDRERRAEEGKRALVDGEGGGKRRRRRGGKEGEEGMPPPPSTAVEEIDQGKKTEETPVRTRESDGAQYGLAGISASDLQRLEDQETANRQ
ncbi:hypothetical protein ABW20_dc0106773 [Dactylellina cionopaga]|nr:hypothetical protein ABW20_dc0106773 [Dactylellina cionopaga]